MTKAITDEDLSGVTPEMLGAAPATEQPLSAEGKEARDAARWFQVAFQLGGISEQLKQLTKTVEKTNEETRKATETMKAENEAYWAKFNAGKK